MTALSSAQKAIKERAAEEKKKCAQGNNRANTYNEARALRVVLSFIDQVECLPLLERLVPDTAKHSSGPRAVGVRALLVGLIALPLAGKPNYLSHIADLYNQFDPEGNERLPTEIRKGLRLPDGDIGRRMVERTMQLLEAALAEEITIGEGDDEHTTTINHLLGVDIPRAIIATSGDSDLYATATATCDSTPLEGISRKAKSVDKKTGEVTYGSDRDAVYVHKREDIMRDGRDLVPGFKGEAICASPDIPHNLDASTLGIPPHPRRPLRIHRPQHRTLRRDHTRRRPHPSSTRPPAPSSDSATSTHPALASTASKDPPTESHDSFGALITRRRSPEKAASRSRRAARATPATATRHSHSTKASTRNSDKSRYGTQPTGKPATSNATKSKLFGDYPKPPTATGTTPPPSASADSTNAPQPPTASSEQ